MNKLSMSKKLIQFDNSKNSKKEKKKNSILKKKINNRKSTKKLKINKNKIEIVYYKTKFNDWINLITEFRNDLRL